MFSHSKDLIAHAGLEMTVTEVYKKANRMFVKYAEDHAERGPIPACRKPRVLEENTDVERANTSLSMISPGALWP